MTQEDSSATVLPAGNRVGPIIADVVHRVVNAVRPLRVVLFGSAARGDGGPQSDIDLLVIVRDGTQRRRTAQSLHRLFYDVSVGIDIVVATAADIDQHGDRKGLIYRTALSEGVVVYAA